jgi:hypothetical protein
VDEAVKEGASRDDGGAGGNGSPVAKKYACNMVVFTNEVDDFGLLDEEVGDGLELFAHAGAVESFITLCAGAPDGGAAGGVEETELDAAGVGDFAHNAAKSIYLPHEVSLRHSTDRRVAGHLRDEIKVQREERGAEAHAGGGGSGFAAGVASTNDEDVEMFREGHG